MGVSKTFMKYIEHSKNNKKSMNKYYNNVSADNNTYAYNN